MILVVVLTLLLGVDCSQAQHKYNALSFAGGPDDKIEWYPDMTPFATQMSICTWINRRSLDLIREPVVLSYKLERQFSIYVQPTEDWNLVVSSLRLSDKYDAPVNKWYHICYTWGNYVIKSYFNGQEVGSTTTDRRQFITGGKMSVGNRVDAYGPTRYAFAGELFKLNFFNRVLNSTEIREMASDMCSSYEEEEILNLNRTLKWEDIMLQQGIRGNVTEIPTDCPVVPEPDTKERLRRIEERLNTAEQELKETKTSLNNTQEELTETMRILKCHEDTLQRHFRYRLTRDFHFHFHFRYRLTRDFHFHFRYRLTRDFYFHFR